MSEERSVEGRRGKEHTAKESNRILCGGIPSRKKVFRDFFFCFREWSERTVGKGINNNKKHWRIRIRFHSTAHHAKAQETPQLDATNNSCFPDDPNCCHWLVVTPPVVLTSIAADPQEATAAAALCHVFWSVNTQSLCLARCQYTVRLRNWRLWSCVRVCSLVLVRERIGKNIICKQNIPWYKEGLEKIFMCKLYSE